MTKMRIELTNDMRQFHFTADGVIHLLTWSRNQYGSQVNISRHIGGGCEFIYRETHAAFPAPSAKTAPRLFARLMALRDQQRAACEGAE